MFGRKCYIKRNDEKLGKLNARADEGIFFGYSQNKKCYRCHKKNTKRIVDCIEVKVDKQVESEFK